MGSTIYTEVFVLALVLISNVLGNNFHGYIPRTATEIAARPQAPSPKLLLQVRKIPPINDGLFCRRSSVLRDPHQMQMNLKRSCARPFGIPASPQLTGGALAEAVACKARASTLPDWDSDRRIPGCLVRDVQTCVARAGLKSGGNCTHDYSRP